jgi:hypothetical protein
MRRTLLLIAIVLALSFIAVGCEKEPSAVEQKVIPTPGSISSQNSGPMSSRDLEDTNPDPFREQQKKHPWLAELAQTTWDKIVISHPYSAEHERVTVEDPIILEGMRQLYHIKGLSDIAFSSGYQSDIPSYTYEIFAGGTSHKINVVYREIIEAEEAGEYFETARDIHLIGNAFMPKPWYVNPADLLTKMANSGAVRRADQYIQFDAFRVQLKLSPLYHDAKPLTAKPEDPGRSIETYIFYYYGEELYLNVYPNYVLLKDFDYEEWYALLDAGTIMVLEPG